jgi:hypothetical protein
MNPGAAGKNSDRGLESRHALHVIDRLVDRASRLGARFEIHVIGDAWVRVRWQPRPGARSIRLADRCQGPEGVEHMLTVLEQELEWSCSNS